MKTSAEIVACPNLSRSCIQAVVAVLDGEAAVRRSMQALVESAGWRARTFASATEFLAQPRSDIPSCLLLEVQLPDIGGLELQAQMADRPETPLIFMTSHADISMTVRAMKAGAIEFLTKPVRDDVILRALEHAVAFSARMLRRESEVSLLRRRYQSLSVREQEVLQRVVQGYLNKQVGHELGISEITVKAHRGRVMRKMAAASLPHLVNMVSSLGLQAV